MIDPSVLNYFLVVLGGFSVVWSYRCVRNQQEKKIGEFEYAAFSALWGIPVFLLYVWLGRPGAEVWDTMFKIPMLTTPILALIGGTMGLIGALIMHFVPIFWKNLRKKLKRS